MTPTEARSAEHEPAHPELRELGLAGILAILVIFAGNAIFAPLSAVFVLVWVRLSGTPWADIGYVRPKNWLRTVVVGIVFGATFKLVMKAIVMPLLGAPPINEAFHFLVGNAAALPGMLFAVIVGAGFGEETLFRGFLFERLGKVLGSSATAKVAIVLVTSAFFGTIHYPLQGLAGAQQATIFGLVFGSIFAIRPRLVVLMVAHAAFDVAAVALIYWDLESKVARIVFP